MTNDANMDEEVGGYAIYETAIALVKDLDICAEEKRCLMELLAVLGQPLSAWLKKNDGVASASLVSATVKTLGLVIRHIAELTSKENAQTAVQFHIASTILSEVLASNSGKRSCPDCQALQKKTLN